MKIPSCLVSLAFCGRVFSVVLHVATAIHCGADELLTFDSNQRKLATAEGLKVKP